MLDSNWEGRQCISIWDEGRALSNGGGKKLQPVTPHHICFLKLPSFYDKFVNFQIQLSHVIFVDGTVPYGNVASVMINGCVVTVISAGTNTHVGRTTRGRT